MEKWRKSTIVHSLVTHLLTFIDFPAFFLIHEASNQNIVSNFSNQQYWSSCPLFSKYQIIHSAGKTIYNRESSTLLCWHKYFPLILRLQFASMSCSCLHSTTWKFFLTYDGVEPSSPETGPRYQALPQSYNYILNNSGSKLKEDHTHISTYISNGSHVSNYSQEIARLIRNNLYLEQSLLGKISTWNNLYWKQSLLGTLPTWSNVYLEQCLHWILVSILTQTSASPVWQKLSLWCETSPSSLAGWPAHPQYCSIIS